MRRTQESASSSRERPGRLLRRVLPDAVEPRRRRHAVLWPTSTRVMSVVGGLLAVWLIWEIRGLGETVVRASSSSTQRTPPIYLLSAQPAPASTPPPLKALARARLGAQSMSSIEREITNRERGWRLDAQWPGDTTIEELRRRFNFCWGRDVALDPKTGRPLEDSIRWDSCKGFVPWGRESKGGGGYVLVPDAERNLPASQLPSAYWEDKRREIDMLALRVEKEELLNRLANEQSTRDEPNEAQDER